MSILDIPGYALISGGEYNGCYTNGNQYFRLSDGELFNIDNGMPAAGPRRAAPARKAEPEQAESAPLATVNIDAPADEPAKADAKPARTFEQRVDDLVADHTPKQLKEMLKLLIDNGADAKIDNTKSAKATRMNAAAILRNTED